MTWHAIIQPNLIALVSPYSLSLNSDRYSRVRVTVRGKSEGDGEGEGEGEG